MRGGQEGAGLAPWEKQEEPGGDGEEDEDGRGKYEDEPVDVERGVLGVSGVLGVWLLDDGAL